VPLLVQLRSDLLPVLRQRHGTGQPVGGASDGALRLARLERDARHLLSLVFSGALLRLQRLEWRDSSEALKVRCLFVAFGRLRVNPAWNRHCCRFLPGQGQHTRLKSLF
jgi:hypothetical protein